MIVKAGMDRLDDLEPLWWALAQHHQSIAPGIAPLRERAETWRRRRAHYEAALSDPRAFVLIAEDGGGTPVGYAMVTPSPPSHTWAIDVAVTVETLVVLPEARGSGLGGALMERIREETRAAGVTHLALSAVAVNEAAIRFYRRHGFEPAFVEMLARP